MRMLEDYLRRNSVLYPDKAAVVCGGREVTYGELWERVRACAGALAAQGLSPGKAEVMRTSQTADFLVRYFAVHLAGGTAVPLGKDVPDECCRKVARLVGDAVIPPGVADILFTTGTTGDSKGVMVGHGAILANAENLVEAQGYSHGLTFVVCGPLNHIGSLSKVYPVVLTGGTLYLTEGMKDIGCFFSALDYPASRFATFLVPAAIRMLLDLGGDRLREHAGDIEFIETGAAPLAQSDMDRLCGILPGARLYNTYASTETGIVCTHDFNGGKRVAGCLGRPMKHSQVFITEDGTVACRGKTLMAGYAGRKDMTDAVLRDGTLFTRDTGMIDRDGMLHLTGRQDDVINVGGFKVEPSEVEDAALSLPEVRDCVCIPAEHPVMGCVLKLLVVPADGCALDKKKIARHILSKLEPYKVPSVYEAVDSIRRTYNGKTDRKSYR